MSIGSSRIKFVIARGVGIDGCASDFQSEKTGSIPVLRFMKHYPSISKEIRRDIDVYVYDKLDGSNIRAEWSPKNGFYKFGTRKRLLGSDDPNLGEAIELILTDFSKQLTEVFKKELRAEGAVAYFEFCGPHSFAGLHENEPHACSLIDVEIKKQGFIEPNRFEKLFQNEVVCAHLLHHGKMNHLIEAQVRAGSLPGMTFEGVVCKAPAPKKWALPVMFKVKNQAWIDLVKSLYNDPRILEDLL